MAGLLYQPLGTRKYTVSNSVKKGLAENDAAHGLAGNDALPSGAVRCRIYIETANIRVADNATQHATLSSTVGTVYPKDQPLWYEGDLALFKMISTGSDATVWVDFYGPKLLNEAE